MNAFSELIEASETLLAHIQNDLPKNPDARDEFIDKIEVLLGDRQKIIDELIKRKVKSEDPQLNQKIISLNQMIDQRLKALQLQIRRDINIFRDKKVKNRKYDNPYEGPTLEGAFIDKRGV